MSLQGGEMSVVCPSLHNLKELLLQSEFNQSYTQWVFIQIVLKVKVTFTFFSGFLILIRLCSAVSYCQENVPTFFVHFTHYTNLWIVMDGGPDELAFYGPPDAMLDCNN